MFGKLIRLGLIGSVGMPLIFAVFGTIAASPGSVAKFTTQAVSNIWGLVESQNIQINVPEVLQGDFDCVVSTTTLPLNLREAPTTASNRLFKFKPGTTLHIVEVRKEGETDWGHTKYEHEEIEYEGWVSLDWCD